MTTSNHNEPDDSFGPWEPDPEDFMPRVRRKIPLEEKPPFAHATPVLLFLLACIVATLIYLNFEAGALLAASGKQVFGEHEYWRLLTSVLTHSDFVHLLSNTPLLFIFGWFLRSFFGLAVFPGLALAIGMLTTLLTVYEYPPGVRLVGASGMVYGMVGLWLVFYVRYDTRYSISMRIFRALGFAILLLVPTTVQKHISYLAHGIGFALGLSIALLALPFMKRGAPPSGGAPITYH